MQPRDRSQQQDVLPLRQSAEKAGGPVEVLHAGGRLNVPVGYVFIHHTEGNSCSDQKSCSSIVKGIFDYHKNTKKWGDIGYNCLIGGEGRVYEGRGWDRVGAQTYSWGSKSIGIAFIGSYGKTVPSSRMQSAAKNLILCGISKGKIRKNYGLYGHRDATCTSCPGDAFYKALKSWTNWHHHQATSRDIALPN